MSSIGVRPGSDPEPQASDPRLTPLICLVTDRRALTPGARTTRDEIVALERQLDEAIDAGVDLVQVRERDLPGATLRALVAAVVGRAGGATRVVVNDRVDVAVAAGAVGAHLRADGPPAAAVRALVPRPWLLGRSVHSTTEARAAAETDYLVFGTVFASASKPPDAPVAGPAALQQTVREAAVPVLAIGGITAARAAACRAAGAAGLAAIGIFLPRGRAPGALGPSAAVAALRSGWLDPSGW